MVNKSAFGIISALFLLSVLSSSAFAASNVIVTTKDVHTVGNSIVAVIGIKNAGDQTAGSFLVEIQPKYGSCTNPLSTISTQSACDSRYPQNIHQTITGLAAGDTATVVLSTPALPSGTYCVVGVSADSCCPNNPNCAAVAPFGWGLNIKEITVTGNNNAVCGNSICEPTETPGSCSQDCAGYCGDNYCNPATEDSSWCVDCSQNNIIKILINFLTNYWYIVAAIVMIIVAVILVVKK